MLTWKRAAIVAAVAFLAAFLAVGFLAEAAEAGRGWCRGCGPLGL